MASSPAMLPRPAVWRGVDGVQLKPLILPPLPPLYDLPTADCAGAGAVGFEGVASGTGCAGARVTGSRGFTGVLLADSWAGCAPHPTISTVTIAVMIAGFTMGQHSSRRWRSSRFFFTRRLQGRKRFFRRDFAGLSGSHSARRRDVPRRSGRRPRPRPWSLDCRARRWPVPRRSRVR